MRNRTSTLTRTLAMTGILLGAAALLVPAPLFSQAAADAIFRDFEPIGEFLFELGGQELENAEIYVSNRAAAYLVMAPELASPVLINPRTQSADSVHLMKVSKQPDGRINLLADATFDRLSGLSIDGTAVNFDVKGQAATLKPKPPLVGFRTADELGTYKPEYARISEGYRPSSSSLQALRGVSSDVKVLIYFGTWCPTCGRLVPKVMKIAEELEGSKLDFQYYGLPRNIGSDAAAKRDDIHGVPTGIVYIGGKEVGRLDTAALNAPEGALAKMLGGR